MRACLIFPRGYPDTFPRPSTRGGVRRNAYAIACREARECLAAIDVAGRWGYVHADASVVDRIDKIVATLVRLTMPRA